MSTTETFETTETTAVAVLDAADPNIIETTAVEVLKDDDLAETSMQTCGYRIEDPMTGVVLSEAKPSTPPVAAPEPPKRGARGPKNPEILTKAEALGLQLETHRNGRTSYRLLAGERPVTEEFVPASELQAMLRGYEMGRAAAAEEQQKQLPPGPETKTEPGPTIALTRAQLAVVHMVAKEEGRAAFNHVHVGPDGLTATDGHALVNITWPGGEDPEVEPRLLDGQVVGELKKGLAFPWRKDAHALIAKAAPQGLAPEVLDIQGTNGSVRYSVPVVDARFPNYQSFMDAARVKESETRMTVVLSIKQLERMVAALKALGSAEYVQLTVERDVDEKTGQVKGLRPIVFEAKNDTVGSVFTGVQMPCKT